MTLPPDDLERLRAAGLRLDGLAIYSGADPVARIQGTGEPSTTVIFSVGGARRWLPFNKLDGGQTRSAVRRFCEAMKWA